MTNKFLLPIFALFFLVAGLISSAGYAQSNIFTKPLRKSSTPIPCQHSKLSQSSKSTIYKQIILFFINNGELQPKHVNYRTETIEPKYLEELNSPVYQEDFSKGLVNNFIKENKITYQIPKFPSLLNMFHPTKGDPDILKFAQEMKNIYSKDSPINVLLLSNLGIDDSHRQGLVYTEFYGEDKKIIRQYLHLILLKNEIKADVDEITKVIVANTITVGYYDNQ